MLTTEVFRAKAFRLALAFCLAVSVATTAAFGLIYLQVARADVQRVGAILVDEFHQKRRTQRRTAASGA